MIFRQLGISLLAFWCMPWAHADTTGYIEYSSLYNDNYVLAAGSADRQSETVNALSATLVQSTPIGYKTALLATGGFSQAWYRRFEDLSGPVFFLNGGVHHRLNYRSTFTGFIGVYRKHRDNAQQDYDGWSARANFIRQLDRRYWMNGQLFYEQGAARNLPDDYRGYGLSAWLHRRFENHSMLSGAVTAANKAYDDPLERDFNNFQLLTEWLYPFRKQFYTRAGLAYTVAGNSGNYEHRSVIGMFTLGYQFSW